MNRKVILVLTLMLVFGFENIKAQLTISGEVRPRGEYRHGFKKLVGKDHDAAVFVEQRSRINFTYEYEKYRLGVSIQDVRVWGDVKQANTTDLNKSAIHEAWGEILFSDKVALKLGRQELVYDDGRILSNSNWASQARSHDLALLKLKFNENSKLHFGLALNNESAGLAKPAYSLDSYKNMQFAWFNHRIDKLQFSLILMNVGIEKTKPAPNQNETEVRYNQTFGTHIKYNPGSFFINGSAYGQSGKSPDGRDLSAFMFDINGGVAVADALKLVVGFQMLSGTDTNDGKTNKSFSPFYGAKHKFHGTMDYFYRGNHFNSVGLTDINGGLKYSKNKFSFDAIVHAFMTAADYYTGDKKENSFLGTEIDLSCGYKLSKGLVIKAGYSQMIATETMELLKGGDKSELQNWAWAMVVFKPKWSSKPAK